MITITSIVPLYPTCFYISCWVSDWWGQFSVTTLSKKCLLFPRKYLLSLYHLTSMYLWQWLIATAWSFCLSVPDPVSLLSSFGTSVSAFYQRFHWQHIYSTVVFVWYVALVNTNLVHQQFRSNNTIMVITHLILIKYKFIISSPFSRLPRPSSSLS